MRREEEGKILHRLEEWAQREGQLPDSVELYRQLLRIQSEVFSHFTVPKPSFGEGTVSERSSQGISLLSFQELVLDWEQIGNLAREVIALVTKDSPDLANEVQRVEDITSNAALLEQAVKAWCEGSSLSEIAAAQNVDEQLFAFVIETALKPFMSAYADVLLPLVDQESWRRRYCPVCGGKPDFAFLDKDKGARWLVCSRCDAEWLFQRLQCPYCGTQNQDALAYFTDDEGVYRLYVCEECQTYIKAIDLRRTESDVLLERILTLDMDVQAQQAGYKKGSLGFAPDIA